MKRFVYLLMGLAFLIAPAYGADQSLGNFKSIAVDGAKAEKTIVLPTDSMAIIELESTPSTGYRWEVINASRLKGVVREVHGSPYGAKDAEYAPVRGRVMPGAPQTQLIRFVGEKKGIARVTLAYRRPWEAGHKKLRHFTLRSKGKFKGKFIRPTLKKSDAEKAADAEALSQITAPGLPAHWDWREQGVVTPVRDQGYCGSCWAFGTVAAFESKIMMKDKVAKDLSEQYIVSCNNDGWSCGGGWWAHDYHWMKAMPQEPGAGARYEAEFPYQAKDVPCNSPHTPYEQLEGWAYTDDIPDTPAPTIEHIPTIAQLKQKIYDYGPVGTDICSTTWGSYTGGIFTNHCSPSTHIVLITGWDDAEGVFYIKNSWGTTWGENGYMRIAYNVCNVGHNSTYLLYEKTNPRIIYRSGLFHEDKANNGSIGNSAELRIEDSTADTQFAKTSGSFVEGTDYTVANLPPNLSLSIQALSATTAQVSISGNALNHLDVDDVNNLTISFQNAAFTGNNAAAVENATFAELKINFFDPYKLIYKQEPISYVSYANPWQFYWLDGSNYQYGFGLWWYDSVNEPDPNNRRVLKVETYTKPALSYSMTPPANLRPLNYGEEIGPNSGLWAPGGSYGDQHTLAGPAFHEFKGADRYIGFTFYYNGYPVYGWMQYRVSSDGSWGTLIDYAWQQDPNKTIQAGYTTDSSGTAPTASFSANPTTVNEGGSVQFTDHSINSPTSWEWTFNGGTPSTSTSQNPSVTYNTAGTYGVTLTVSNSYGTDTMTKTGYITVKSSSSPITADFTYTVTDLAVAFTDTSTASGTTISSWQWNFGDGNSSTQQNPSHTYAADGTYSVSLTASDQQGASGTITKSVTVGSVTPPPLPYCTASHLYNYGYITRVQTGSIDNTSGWGTNGYADFTSQSTPMTRGTSYPINVTCENQHWSLNVMGIWVDWNRDGDWNDPNEAVYTYTGAGPYSATITPPASASTGPTRMRVRMLYDRPAVPCGDDTYMGDVEDYTINVN